jgi:hypothetical protein
MRRDEVIARLKETEPALKAFGVGALYLFDRMPAMRRNLTQTSTSLSM